MTQTLDDSRLHKRKQKRRKLFLNILIGIVFFAAVTVAYQLFSSPKQTVKSNNVNQNKVATDAKNATSSAASTSNAANPSGSTSQPVEDKKVVVQQSDPKVTEAYTNPSWKPVGTSQSEPHTTKFDTSSQDWKEMVQTISYALKIPTDNLTILFIGNNGENKAVGTVKAKDTEQRYKVNIEWADKQGWKPTLVQQLK
ncbi:YrrS family protein [Ectobacillus sp. sgz5001026]|uniref:YrrS family protein n=1 Tax=Ectobacillus sp. sgz5001026 TaxID=3242473 RepID=UPI0036D2F030